MKGGRAVTTTTIERKCTFIWILFNRFITFAISLIITSYQREKTSERLQIASSRRMRQKSQRIYFASSTYFNRIFNKNKEPNVEFIFIFGVKIKPFFCSIPLSLCVCVCVSLELCWSFSREWIPSLCAWNGANGFWLAPVSQPKDTEWTRSTHSERTRERENVCRRCPNIHI